MWQDYVFAVGIWGFTLAMLPAIRAKEKPPISTSVLTVGFFLLFVAAYASLGLIYAAISEAFATIPWLVVLLQKLKKGD